MGVLLQGINGPVSGKVGNVVFYQVGNQTRARSLPYQPKKKRKPTPRQELQRAKFKLMQDWLRPMKPLLRIGFRQADSPRSGHNAAMSYNINHAVIDNDGVFAVNPEMFKFAQGSLPAPHNPAVRLKGNELHFTWEKPDTYTGLGLARTVLLICNSVDRYCYWHSYGADAYRLQDMLDLTYFAYETGDVCYAYIAFIHEENGQVSDSVYAGTITMAPRPSKDK